MSRAQHLGRPLVMGVLLASTVGGLHPVDRVAATTGLTGDCRAELAIGRNAGNNQRYRVDDFEDGDWTTILDDGGNGWGNSRGVTAMAMGDVDGDGDDELAIGRSNLVDGEIQFSGSPHSPFLLREHDGAELLAGPDKDRADRAMRAMLQMKKLDLAALQAAADGR